MDKKTVFIKTPKGESGMSGMSGDMKRVMLLIDDKSTLDEVTRRAPPSLRGDLREILQQLQDTELIRDKDQSVATTKIIAPKMAIPKAASASSEELDFTNMGAPAPSAASIVEAKHKQQLDAEAARARNELEASVAAAKLKASAEAKAKAEAKARQEAEIAARVKAEADAEAEAARIKAEQKAATARAELEAARARAEAEAKALAEELARQEAEAARLRAEHEVALIRAKQEAAAKAEAEERARQEAAARAKAEAEERAKQEAEARVRAEQEEARLLAEQKAARAKAELEAARVRVEEEARALAAERARQEAAARDKAELEARTRQAAETARLNAEMEATARQATAAEEKISVPDLSPFTINLDALSGAAQTPAQPDKSQPNLVEQAEAEAQAKQEAERHAEAEQQKSKLSAAAEMARMKADMEAARLRAEQEARAKAEEQALAEEQANAWAEAEQRAKLQAKLDAEQAVQQSAISQAKAEQKPVARARRKPLPLGKIFLGLIVLLLLAVVALPYVWPMQKYVASMEQSLSAQLKQPVHIGGMSAAWLPPKLQLQNITVGNAQEVKIGTAQLNFDPMTLFSENKTISDVELQHVVLDGRHLEQVAGWLQGFAGNAQYTVRHLTISSLQVSTDEVTLPSLKGSAELAQGAFTRVVLHSEDEKINVEFLSVKNAWQVSYAIKEMALPMLPGVQFSDFSAKGDIGDGEVNFTEINAHAYGGAWSGNGVLGWRKGWHAQGRMQAKEMDLEKIYPKIGTSSEVQVEGTFLLQGVKLSQMGDAPHLDGSFMAKNGVINGVGMAETARLLSHEHLHGGRTSFDEMTGMVQLENHNLHFQQVKIRSSDMNASGSFELSASNQLSGNFSVEIKEEAGKNPLVLSGTLVEPKLVAR